MAAVDDLRARYSARYNEVLRPLAQRLQTYLDGLLADTPRVDSVRVRAKSIDRFVEKAGKEHDGQPKYSDPMNQIQDQIGSRIIMFYPSDVERICGSHVTKYFRAIEERAIVPDSPREFDYEGKHFILFIPQDVLDQRWKRGDYPTFFELQVKTLFQHSWAEANHDLAYKAPTELTLDQRRKVAYTAAQAWGADQMFQALAEELGIARA
jgi:ppGpp synthetase/RelA/SpoT-type nucleotidyltranferase